MKLDILPDIKTGWCEIQSMLEFSTMLYEVIKKGPDVTLAQVLEISRLETATQQLLSQMSNMKPSVNYVRYNKKRRRKVESLHNSNS